MYLKDMIYCIFKGQRDHIIVLYKKSFETFLR